MKLGSSTETDQLAPVSATVDLATTMLEMEQPVYNYATGNLTWTVEVNGAGLPLKDLELTDVLPAGLAYVEDSLQVGDTTAADKATWNAETRTLTIELGDLDEKTATLTFKTTANPDVLFAGANDVKIENTIEMTGTAYEDEDEDEDTFVPVTSTAEETFTNHGLVKQGELNETTGQIAYTVLINPFGVTLAGDAVTDTMDDALRLDPASVELYEAELTGEDENGAPTFSTGDKVTDDWSFTNDPENHSFTVNLPDGTGSYVLTYSADMLDASQQSYTNRIAFVGGGMGGQETCDVVVDGTLPSATGSLTLTAENEKEEPFKNVTFSLYLWDEGQRGPLLDQGVTDGDGNLTFAALKAGQSYELAETFPEGYQQRYTVEETLPVTGAALNSAGNLVITPTSGDDAFAFTIQNSPETSGSSGGGSPTYRPDMEQSEGGEVSVSPQNPHRGDDVTITPEPDEGYAVDEVTVTDKNGNEVEVTDNGDGTFSFTQPSGKVTIEVTFREIAPDPLPFTDVNAGAWYEDAVRYVWEHGLMTGTGADIFSPQGTTTRAQIVTILWRLSGSPQVNYLLPFDDVAEGTWYTEAVRWAAGEGIVTDTGATTFAPGDPITREQLAVMLHRYAQHAGYDTAQGGMAIREYRDYGEISGWALEAMDWAVGAGIIGGVGENTLAPGGTASRAEAAAMLMRFCQQYGA